MHIKLIEGLPK